jgi:hypothetical protein
LDRQSSGRAKFHAGYLRAFGTADATERWIKDKPGGKPALTPTYAFMGYYFMRRRDVSARYWLRRLRSPWDVTAKLRNKDGTVDTAAVGESLFYGSYPITLASDILHEAREAQELRRPNVSSRG